MANLEERDAMVERARVWLREQGASESGADVRAPHYAAFAESLSATQHDRPEAAMGGASSIPSDVFDDAARERRDEFAKAALIGFLSAPPDHTSQDSGPNARANPAWAAAWAYDQAEAMLAESALRAARESKEAK